MLPGASSNAEGAAQALDEFGLPFEADVLSAHRMPHQTVEYAVQAHQRGLGVIIAGAGGAAHLPGVVAALTPEKLHLASGASYIRARRPELYARFTEPNPELSESKRPEVYWKMIRR